MPAKDPAEYMRQRRLREKLASKAAAEGFMPLAEKILAPEPVKKEGYQCGCEPGNKCLAHGIQAMSQQRRDAILKLINRPTK